MADVTIRNTGTWVVELNRPLSFRAQTVTQIEIKPPRWDQQIRLADQEITSMLGLLAEMCDLPEQLLRELTYPDVDRVMLAFHNCLPPIMRQQFEQGKYTLATPKEELEEPAEVRVTDQSDPRFPQFEGPVRRFKEPPKVDLPISDKKVDEGSGLSLDVPGEMRAVS